MVREHGYNSITGEYNDSLTGEYLWASVNVREASPDVMTPYTWSAIRHEFSQMTMLPGYLPVGNICGRLYNNASATATALQVLGQRNLFDASSKELYGVDPGDITKWNVPLLPVGLRDRVHVFRNALRIMVNVRNGLKSMDAFLENNPTWCEIQHRTLPELNKAELIRWAVDVFLPYMMRCFWAMGSPAIMQSNVISKLRGDLLQVVNPDDTVTLLSNVSTEEDFLASLGIVAGLDWLRRGKMSREAYVKRYGHRGPHEVELSIPRPAENPNWIDEQLDSLEYAPVDVDTLLKEQRARYNAALKNLQKAAPGKFDPLMKRLKEAARLTRLRESGRSETIRAIWVSRAFVLRAGALSGLDEEAFFLEYEKLLHLLGEQDESTNQIPVRKNAYQRFSSLPQYPTLIVGAFDPFAWAVDPNHRTDIYDPAGRINQGFTKQIKGLPGSAGQSEGRVRIVSSPEDGNQLQPGEILVAVTTNVGWTPLFPRAAAVVTDVGAPLSHAAIVARELGIPAVVGCFNATTILKTGDRVRVDGGSGTVEILEQIT